MISASDSFSKFNPLCTRASYTFSILLLNPSYGIICVSITACIGDKHTLHINQHLRPQNSKQSPHFNPPGPMNTIYSFYCLNCFSHLNFKIMKPHVSTFLVDVIAYPQRYSDSVLLIPRSLRYEHI